MSLYIQYLFICFDYTFKAQYVFVHEAVLESVLCGDTSIPSNNFILELNKLKHLDPATSQTGLEKQYKVQYIIYYCFVI